jgi:hypothetical protein
MGEEIATRREKRFSPDGKDRPLLNSLPPTEHELADVTIQALEILMQRRNECVYRGRAWMKLNNACCWVSDSFWKEVRKHK